MRAVLMMYKVFLRYPEALRPAFPKLKEKLEDSDPGTNIGLICIHRKYAISINALKYVRCDTLRYFIISPI